MQANLDKTIQAKSSRSVFVRPAFENKWQMYGFLAVVVFALFLPVLITRSGVISRQNSYEIMPENQGAFSFVKKEIFEKREDVDVLFIGSSTLFAGFDTPMIDTAFKREFGETSRVITFGHYFNSIDISYMQLRDFLERKNAGIIVLSIPRIPYPEGPSTIAYRFIRYSDEPEIFEELPLQSEISLYACSVLRSPRDVLSVIRPNLSNPSGFEKSLGSEMAKMGMGRNPHRFEEIHPISQYFEPNQIIYSSETRDRFQFTNDDIAIHQKTYLKKLVELLRSKNVPLVIVNIPQYAERHSEKVIERMDWSREIGADVSMIGIPPSELLAGLSEAEIEKLYYDENHFNKNGNELFTRAILPGIMEVYKKYAKKDH